MPSKEIKTGGFGYVYFSTSRGKKIAIKRFIRPEITTEVIRELCFSSLIKHNSCINTQSVILDGGQFYITMDYGGISLREFQESSLLKTRIEFCMEVLKQMVSALDYLHSNHICHRDVKPDNILIQTNISDSINVQLCDFGLCSNTNYMKELPACTDYYKPPELFIGNEYDESIDIWSLGCTLVEFINKTILFKARGNNILRKIVKCIPTTAEQIDLCELNGINTENNYHHISFDCDVTNFELAKILYDYKIYICMMLCWPDSRCSAAELRTLLDIPPPPRVSRRFRLMKPLSRDINYERRNKSIIALNRCDISNRVFFRTIYIIDIIIEKKELTSLDVYSALSLSNKYYDARLDISKLQSKYNMIEIANNEKNILSLINFDITSVMIYEIAKIPKDALVEIILDRPSIENKGFDDIVSIFQ